MPFHKNAFKTTTIKALGCQIYTVNTILTEWQCYPNPLKSNIGHDLETTWNNKKGILNKTNKL